MNQIKRVVLAVVVVLVLEETLRRAVVGGLRGRSGGQGSLSQDAWYAWYALSEPARQVLFPCEMRCDGVNTNSRNGPQRPG